MTKNWKHRSRDNSYRQRLLHQCRKDLNKQLKICKGFELQKTIRKVKNSKTENHQNSVKEWREFNLDSALKECFKRLGVSDLLEQEANETAGDTPSQADDSSNTTMEPTERESEMIERILQQKRMRDTLEKWSGDIVAYRRWCTRHENDTPRDQKASQRKRPPVENEETDTVQNTSESLFTTLNEKEQDGQPRKKRNRPGQKARRAKMEQYSGKSVTRDNATRIFDSIKEETVPTRTKRKEQEGLSSNEAIHPSWQAKKTQASSIVAFQGKKITFD